MIKKYARINEFTAEKYPQASTQDVKFQNNVRILDGYAHIHLYVHT